MKTPRKFYPVPPRNPALDQFRGRQWSESALFPAAPRLRRVARKFRPSGRVFIISRFEPTDSAGGSCIRRAFAVVASDVIAADNRISILYP